MARKLPRGRGSTGPSTRRRPRKTSRGRRAAALVARAVAWAAAFVVLAPLVVVGPWRWVNPPSSAFILRDDAPLRASRAWAPLGRIAPELQVAVIAAEDQKFPTHRGFDVEQITRALSEDRGRVRGASTITQQVAKNLFLWPGRSWLRKGLEAYLAAWIELCWPKRRILEIYLNVAEFGPGVFGAAPASRYFFAKEAHALTAREAALLAAVLPSPKRMNAGSPSEYVSGRASEIERAARGLGGASYLRQIR